MSITITRVDTYDIRFPTSRALDGSDAMNPDPDYSAAYVILRTDAPNGLEGHGLTFTIGAGSGRKRACFISRPPLSSMPSGICGQRPKVSRFGSCSST